MEGNQGPEAELRSVIALCARALEVATLPESRAGQNEACRRWEAVGRLLVAITNVIALRDT